MFWKGLYLPTCHHNRGSTELHGHKFAVCCVLQFILFCGPFPLWGYLMKFELDILNLHTLVTRVVPLTMPISVYHHLRAYQSELH